MTHQHISPLDFECPVCTAMPNERCHDSASAVMSTFHVSRYSLIPPVYHVGETDGGETDWQTCPNCEADVEEHVYEAGLLFISQWHCFECGYLYEEG